MFKIINGFAPNYLKKLIPLQIEETTNYPLRNRTNFRLPRTRTKLLQQSYLPSTLRQWNNTSPDIRQSKTVNTLKQKLKFQPNPLSQLYSYNFGPYSKYHTQIRLGLSKLRAQLFTINVISDPFCPTCKTSKETSAHFFLECPAFAAQRDEMFRGLRGLLPSEVLNSNKLLLETLTFGTDKVTLQTNITVFTAVHRFIQSSTRFSPSEQ